MVEENYIVNVNDIVVFYGINNSNLQLLRTLFNDLSITARGTSIKVIGEESRVSEFIDKIQLLELAFQEKGFLNEKTIISIVKNGDSDEKSEKNDKNIILHNYKGKVIAPRTENQRTFVECFPKNDLFFITGPAGTGKTYTAIALAVKALKNKEIKKIILCRPAVEAGEKLGFLPGDMKEKIDPYLQPLYDALEDMIHPMKLKELIECGIIQIAPLAFMRGRTLNDAIIILDEAQNTTSQQLKMFLTRLGFNAKMIVTGDTSQIDLPNNQPSGLIEALNIFKNDGDGIKILNFTKNDVVRHKLVTKIIDAYDKYQKK